MKLFKNFILSTFSVATLVAGNSFAMEKPDKYLFANYRKKFTTAELKKYQVDEQTKSALDEQYKGRPIIIQSLERAVKKIVINGHEYYAKLNPHRLIGAATINDLAQEYGLDQVKAPTKRIYDDKYGNRYVIAPAINPVKDPFTLQQIKQIYKVIQKSAYVDCHRENILNTEEGIAYFVDTNKNSFSNATEIAEWQNEDMQSTLEVLKMQLSMTDEARAWLNKKIISMPRCC